MRYSRRLWFMVVATALIGGAGLFQSRSVRAQGSTPYRPGSVAVVPEMPAEFTLHPKFPTHPVAGLYAGNCHYNAVKNDMAFLNGRGTAGVRFLKAPKEVRVAVEFLIRVDRTLAFDMAGTERNGEPSAKSTMILPKGLHRLTVNSRTLTDKESIAEIFCRADSLWYLVSVKVRRA